MLWPVATDAENKHTFRVPPLFAKSCAEGQNKSIKTELEQKETIASFLRRLFGVSGSIKSSRAQIPAWMRQSRLVTSHHFALMWCVGLRPWALSRLKVPNQPIPTRGVDNQIRIRTHWQRAKGNSDRQAAMTTCL